MYKILFVCTGNICRSPTAEGVLRHKLEQAGLAHKVIVDSAGTQGYHVGEPPDMRAVQAAKRRGVFIEGLRARQFMPADFQEFDLILALDGTHMRALERLRPGEARGQLALFLEHAGHSGREVPDPYYGNMEHFEHVLDLTETAADALVAALKAQLK